MMARPSLEYKRAVPGSSGTFTLGRMSIGHFPESTDGDRSEHHFERISTAGAMAQPANPPTLPPSEADAAAVYAHLVGMQRAHDLYLKTQNLKSYPSVVLATTQI